MSRASNREAADRVAHLRWRAKFRGPKPTSSAPPASTTGRLMRLGYWAISCKALASSTSAPFGVAEFFRIRPRVLRSFASPPGISSRQPVLLRYAGLLVIDERVGDAVGLQPGEGLFMVSQFLIPNTVVTTFFSVIYNS